MRSVTTDQFWKCYKTLPKEIKKQAKKAYKQFQIDPYYPSLQFKRIHSTRPVFSIRITINYRALGVIQDDNMIWFWIGSHSDYNKLINK